MQRPTDKTPTGRMIDNGGFTASRLNANEQSKTLLPAFDVRLTHLAAANVAHIATKDGINRMRGPVVEVDTKVGALLTPFHLDLLKFANKNLKHPLYVALLPDGLSPLRKLSGADLLKGLQGMTAHLQDLPKDHALKPYHAQFTAMAGAYTKPLADLAVARTAESKAEVVVNEERTAWSLAYNALYGNLLAMFPGKKAYVESFFQKFVKNGGGNGHGGNGGGGGGGI